MDYTFPVELQRAFEDDILAGTFPGKQHFALSEFLDFYETNTQDASIVLRSAYRKGLISNEINNIYGVLGKNQPAIESVFQHADKSGQQPKSLVRKVEVVLADAFIANQLKIAVAQPVFRQARTRLINAETVANQNNYMPIEVCPMLETIDLTRKSFQVTLEEQFNAVIADIDEQFEVVPATGEDMDILGLSDGAKILAVRRLSLSGTRMPLVWADIHVRIDCYHYVEKLWPEAATLLD